MTPAAPRAHIYYWKCDRAAAFHGTAQDEGRRSGEDLKGKIRDLVSHHFGREPQALRAGPGQGNHLTFIAQVNGLDYFVRIEDGPEQDDYMAVETCVVGLVKAAGIPTPCILASDATRRVFPFAWQIMNLVPQPDLNFHFKAGVLDTSTVAQQIGRLVARWQTVPVEGFGPFDVEMARTDGRLRGMHATYPDYFFTRFEAHFAFLVARGFLSRAQVDEMRVEIERNQDLLALPHGCLVHKDLALWNLLGTTDEVTAVIDWDDCVAADPMDDLSLLGCFHDGSFLRHAFAGYAAVRPFPADHRRRFWLHLLRNLLFKSVIRVGAGYFDRSSKFFLIGPGDSGTDLREFTLQRIATALNGLRTAADPTSL